MDSTKNTFVKSLKLAADLENKIFFKKAVFYKDKNNKDLYFESSEILTASEIYEFLNSIQKHNEFSNRDIFNIYVETSSKGDFKNYELYEYLISFLKLNSFKIGSSDFFFKFKEKSLSLYIATSTAFEIILNNFDNILKLFSNFNIYKDDFKLIHDGSKFKKQKFESEISKNYSKLVKTYQNQNLKVTSGDFKRLDIKNSNPQRKVFFEGRIFSKEVFKVKGTQCFTTYYLKNNDEYISARKFYSNFLDDIFNKEDYLRIYGKWDLNKYGNEFNFIIEDIEKISEKKEEKELTVISKKARTELHIHTKMSTMDGVGEVGEYFKKADSENIKSIAFVDHNSVQAFPEILHVSEKFPNIKPIYGVEFDVFDDLNNPIVLNPRDEDLVNCEYVFFDLETTGISPFINEIIEFGAVRQRNGQIVERKQLFIKTKSGKVPKHITNLTNITNDHIKDAKTIEEVIGEIKEWIGDAILIAHNAKFDYSFLNYAYKKNNLGELNNPVIDTLKLSWFINPTLKNHRLGTVVRNEGIIYDENISHRGDYDASVLQKAFENMLHKLFERDIRNLNDLNKYNSDIIPKIFLNHFTVLAKNQDGIKDLYKLISNAHTKYFNKKRDLPTLPLSFLLKNRKNLLLGSSCTSGKIWEEINYQSNDLEKIFSYYDYIEIFPPSVYENLVNDNLYSKEEIILTIKEIISQSEKYLKRVVVTSNAHYVNKKDHEIREVYISNKGLGGRLHPLYRRNAIKQKHPFQYLRSNEEIYDEFKLFIKDEKLLDKIVFLNPNKISKIIDEKISPLKQGLFTPRLENADENLVKLVKENLKKVYGDNPNQLILERFDKELNSIMSNGYSIIYYISSLAVKKSIEDGYLVGSRGSVGSSLIATLAEITEVNPLEPHYLCSNCKYHIFVDNVTSGYDLEDKKCPNCNHMMKGDGQWIPFETFLGFEGKKVPDIDLNFSREYQSIAHGFIKTLLGKDNVFRAGTISTVAERTAFGYVKNWLEQNELEIPNAKLKYLAEKTIGTKRTTGQHPGGLIILPKDKDIYDFTPINYPGNDLGSDWLTTHFDFHSIHDNLLKLDFLGHLDPSSIKMLQELTNINPLTIPKNDKKVISLFQNSKALEYKKIYIDDESPIVKEYIKNLKYKENYTGEVLGIIGISEFGTKFVRDIVRTIKPKKFSELIRISGFSHGTDVWSGNAKELFEKKIASLEEIISVRDDIMTYLIKKGIDEFVSFQIMESVRKGKGLRPEWEDVMRKHDIPEWYLESSRKIKYIFPKAHATAYVLMAYRIAWYKINYPLEYYATFFTKRDTQFDIKSLNKGLEGIIEFKERVKKLNKKDLTDKDKEIDETYNIVLEMYSRGFSISELSLEKSHGNKWLIDYDMKLLIPPFSILEGLGQAALEKLIASRDKELFTNFENFKAHSGLNKTIIAKFEELGLLKNLKNYTENKNRQLFLFDN